MPNIEGLADDELELVCYETTSEGTPMCPNFPNTQQGKIDLVNHCVEKVALVGLADMGDIETWAGILFADASGMMDIHSKAVRMSTPLPKEED